MASAAVKRIAAGVVAAISIGVAIFQSVLALGLPYGAAAWGGLYQTLPAGLRLASTASAAVLLSGALIALSRAQMMKTSLSAKTLRLACLAFASLTTLSTVANLASSSETERLIMLPLVSISAIGWWILVL